MDTNIYDTMYEILQLNNMAAANAVYDKLQENNEVLIKTAMAMGEEV